MYSNSKYAVGKNKTGIKIIQGKNDKCTWQNDEATFITLTNNIG